MSEGLVISTRGLTKRYKQVVAVKHLGGTVFGFLEPNGAGKTTTIRMLRGLVRPSAGRAEVLGHDIVTDRRAITPRVGAIVERPAFYTYITGAENLEVLWRSSNLPVGAVGRAEPGADCRAERPAQRRGGPGGQRLVVACMIGLLLGASIKRFRRRDMAGE